MLPAIASFFNTTIDELLGVDEAKREVKIQEILKNTIGYSESILPKR